MNRQYGSAFALIIGIVALIGLLPHEASAATLKLKALPTAATANSVWTFEALWEDPEGTLPFAGNHKGVFLEDIVGDGVVMLKGVGGGLTDGIPMLYVGKEGDGRLYRVSVSAGLNMSAVQQWPNRWKNDTPVPTPTPNDYEYITPHGYDSASYIPDPELNNLLWDPHGHPMWYAPDLKADDSGAPKGRGQIYAIAYKLIATPDPLPDPLPDPTEVKSNEISVTVYDSSPATAKYDYGGVAGDRDYLSCYPAGNWPVETDVFPLTVEPLLGSDPMQANDGSSSNQFVFRVTYRHMDSLAPNPWFRSQRFDGITGKSIPDSGVVLYLDLAGTGDYKLYPMFLEAPTSTPSEFPGQVYILRFLPFSAWMKSPFNTQVVPPFITDWGYSSLACGTYQYFFGCSDDSLQFLAADGDPKHYVFEYQPAPDEWGAELGKAYREDNILDPKLSRAVTGYPEINRPAHRRYSTDGSTDFDYTIPVDRPVRVPGYFESWASHPYPWKSSEHPVVTCQLIMPSPDDNGVAIDDDTIYGGGRYYGTLQPFKRMVNPLMPGAFVYGSLASRAEGAGATTATDNTFRIQYKQIDNKPPLRIQVWINNASAKSKIAGVTEISGVSERPASDYTYTAYTLTTSDPSPNYTNGVMYSRTIKLPAGPHSYYFEATDGTNAVMWPRRMDHYSYNEATFEDWWVPTNSTPAQFGTVGYDDNDYVPGPYVNHACALTDCSVTPSSGKMGQSFRFRVKYTDADGQRPNAAWLGIQTSNDGQIRWVRMTQETALDSTADNSAKYKQGVYYYFDTGTVQDLVLETGTRQYTFKFTDDWGRQIDNNDFIAGEDTIMSSDSTGVPKIWHVGPTVTQNFAPTLTEGKFESPDGTANSATLWKCTVKYTDQNNDPPALIKIHLGVLQADGKSVIWDNGHTMAQTDSSDKVYTDGAAFYYQTRLEAGKKYFYSFVAFDGVLWAQYDAATSASATVVVDQALTTSDQVTYTMPVPVSGAPVLGPLDIELPAPDGSILDAQISQAGTLKMVDDLKTGWQATGDVRYSVMTGVATKADGTLSNEYVVPDQAEYIANVEGIYTDAAMTGTNYYVEPGADGALTTQTGTRDLSDQTRKTLIASEPWRIATVTGIFNNASLTGTNYYTANVDGDGKLALSAAGSSTMYIRYKRTGFNCGDTTVWLTSLLPDAYKGKTVYIKYNDLRFTHQLRGSAQQTSGFIWTSGRTHYHPDGTSYIKPAGSDLTSGALGVWLFPDRNGTNFFDPRRASYTVSSDMHLPLSVYVPAGTSQLWARYYQSGNYNIDRANGKVKFLSALPSGTAVTATYAFGTKVLDPSDPASQVTVQANTPPTLTLGKLNPKYGSGATSFVFTVVYTDRDGPNGQAPDYVRVYIDGNPFTMTAVGTGGTPAFSGGATYTYTASGLSGGNHSYRFEASDGADVAVFDWYDSGQNSADPPATRPTSGQVSKDIDGPWVNNSPSLSNGSASPNPTGGSISTGVSVDYVVTYTDSDGDAPYLHDPINDLDPDTGAAVGAAQSGSPRVWIDSGIDDTSYAGKVTSLSTDPLAPTKYRTITAVNDSGVAPGWTDDQFAGKLLQVTNGTLSGRVYLIQSNTSDSLVIATEDLATDGVSDTVGSETTFRINGLLMFKSDSTQQDFAKGVVYKLTVPKLAVGSHKFHFTARSRVTMPGWLFTDTDVTGVTWSPYSNQARFPAADDTQGPEVKSTPPDGNVAPVISTTAATSLFSGPYAKRVTVNSATQVKIDTADNWTASERDLIREVYGVYLNATLDANATVSMVNYYDTANAYSSGDTVTCTTIPAQAAGTTLVQFGNVANTLLEVIPDQPTAIGTVTGVYLTSAMTGTNYYGSFDGTKIATSTPLPSGTTKVYVKYTLKSGVTWPPVYLRYFTKHTDSTVFLSGQPLTFRVKYHDADNDPPTYHDGVQGYVRLAFNDGSAPRSMVLLDTTSTTIDYKTDVQFTLTATDVPEGQRKYHFEGSDGYDPQHAVRFPTAAGDPTANDYNIKVNYKPVLSSGKVDPAAGQSATTFVFAVTYKDLDGAGTGKPTPVVNLRLTKIDETPAKEFVYPMTASSTSYATGVEFTVSKTALASGRYTVAFEANDGYQDATPKTVPDLTVRDTNTKPVLVDTSVSPTSGKTISTFVYSAHYLDADNDPPVANLNGVRSEGLILVIDKGAASQQTILMTKATADAAKPYTTAGGVLYQTTPGILGKNLGAGQHTYEVQASDGSDSATATGSGPVLLIPFFDDLRLVSASALAPETADGVTTASVGDRVLIEGLMKFPGKSVTTKPAAIDGLTAQITKPDGTVLSLAASVTMLADSTDANNWVGKIVVSGYPQGADPALVTGQDLTLSASGDWKLDAAWPGDAKWDKAATDNTIDGQNDAWTTAVGGPMRTVAVKDATDPTSAPLVDMITPAMEIASTDVGRIFGFDRAPLMQIVRWDPRMQAYFRYGSQTTFPDIAPGDAVWMKPKTDYPTDTIKQADIESGLLISGNPSTSLDFLKKYRVIRTFSKAYPTQVNPITGATETAPCVIALNTGWNQFGNIFYNWEKVGGVVVTPKVDVGIPIKDVRVRYLNKELTLAQAAALPQPWIRDYAWRFEAQSPPRYVMVRERGGEEQVLKAWSGYWIRAFVDCDLIINPNTTYTGGTISSLSRTESVTLDEELDTPPAIP